MGLVSQSMNLDYIRTFVVTAQSKSMLEASKKMNVTPSYISRHIEGLERSLNTKLLITGTKGQELRLTESGQFFYDKYEKIYNEILLAEKEFMQTQEIENCKITIGTSFDLDETLLKEKIVKFIKKYPNISIKIINESSDNLVKDLTHFSVDLIIDKNMPIYDLKSQEIETVSLFNSNYCLVFNKEKYFKDKIDINTCPLIVPVKNTQERMLINEHFKEINVIPNIKYELENNNIISYVKEGIGVGIVLKDLINSDDLDFIDLDIKTEICLSYIKGNLTASVKELLKLFNN